MHFGEHLRELRLKKGFTLRTLADAVGVDFTYLSKIENGKVDYTPSSDKIRALAQALNTDELDLLELAGKMPPELKPFAHHPNARAFFSRMQEIRSSEDWEDLLQYLDRRHDEKQRSEKEKE